MLLALVLMFFAVATAEAAKIQATLSPESSYEGRNIALTLESIDGPLASNTTVKIASEKTPYWEGGFHGEVVLLAGQSQVVYNFKIDNQTTNIFAATSINIELTADNPEVVFVTKTQSPGNVLPLLLYDDDVDNYPLRFPEFFGQPKLGKDEFIVKVRVPSFVDGSVTLTRGGKLLDRVHVSLSKTNKVRTIKLEIGKREIQKIHDQGGKLTARFYFDGPQGEPERSLERYRF